MSRSTQGRRPALTRPCPFCGRITRVHSRLQLSDVEPVGCAARTSFATVICRDCAFAMVVRSEAAFAVAG
ncbi:MAG: hypothetical protein IT304_05800 [Dehalococcoidia bacterium]|nr:hypothetical protein [Dehalococcoidia bacterium]